jgi:hypothetical protein
MIDAANPELLARSSSTSDLPPNNVLLFGSGDPDVVLDLASKSGFASSIMAASLADARVIRRPAHAVG